MLSLLPKIDCREAHSLWYSSAGHVNDQNGQNSLRDDPSGAAGGGAGDTSPRGNLQFPRQQGLNRRAGNVGGGDARGPGAGGNSGQNRARMTPLMRLQREEEYIALRKSGIARFGSAWLKPPGIKKTYQAQLDEQLEREEADALAAREEAMEEAAAAAAQAAGTNMPGAFTDEINDEEAVDLDADIPDGGDLMEDDEEEDEEEEEDDAETNVLGDEDDGIDPDERDLDDEVPEAEIDEQEWQHTDSEFEDEDEDEDSFADRTGGPRFSIGSQRQPRTPSSAARAGQNAIPRSGRSSLQSGGRSGGQSGGQRRAQLPRWQRTPRMRDSVGSGMPDEEDMDMDME